MTREKDTATALKKDALVEEIVNRCGTWVQEDGDNRPMSTGRYTRELWPYDTIFSPIRINRLTVKNRLVMAPMGNCQMAEETGRPNDKMLQYFFARAEGGVGLLTTGLVPISHHIDASVTEKGNYSYFPRIDGTRTNFMGWRDLAQGVHARNSRIFIQLTAGLGRVGNPQCLLTKKQLPVSASWNPNFYIPEIPCRPLTDLELGKIVKNFGQAAADAKTMGMDGVYLHGHEGYLLDQLTNTAFNHRKMGKYADWQRFGLDAVREIRKRTGNDYPIMYRIDLSCALNETYGEKMREIKSLSGFTEGRGIYETLEYMENLVKAGVDIFDVDLGCYDNWWLPHPPAYMPAGCFLNVAKLVKDYFKEMGIRSNAGVEVPVVAVGKLNYPDLDERALRDGDCDMIMLGRPLLADPDWAKKAYAGDVKKIRPCIGCQEACVNEFVEGGHPQCAVNPRTGFEEVLPRVLPAAERKKRIAVVGGGPAGMNFALFAAQRGHTVELYERGDKLGGALLAASAPKNKFDLQNYLAYLCREVETQEGVTLHLNCGVDSGFLKAQSFDAVVYANGAYSVCPPIEGMADSPVVEATDLLCHPEKLGDSRKVTVLGGGAVGMETAYYLSYERGCDVTVIDMLGQFMDGACTANRTHLIHYLEKNGAKLVNCASIQSFHGNFVTVKRNISAGAPDVYCTWQPILPKNIENPLAKKLGDETVIEEYEADLFVNALGRRGDSAPYLEGLREHVADEIYSIGDAFESGLVWAATRSAYHLASSI